MCWICDLTGKNIHFVKPPKPTPKKVRVKKEKSNDKKSEVK